MNDTRLEKLYARRSFGIKPGLDSILDLLKELGNPHKGLQIIHVAGTNGKGSVSSMLCSVLSQMGVKVGLYTSPHLVRLTERFRIGEEEMSEETLEELLGDVEAACERLEAAGKPAPTFFECTTALCLLWWKKRGISLAVVEVGMGGRLDATNVLDKLLTIITRIGLDHTQYLGDTLKKIALEKAGIIRPDIPVVLGAMPKTAREAIAEFAGDVEAPVYNSEDVCGVRRVSGDAFGQKFSVETPYCNYGTIKTSLPGAYQAENIATVITALEVFGQLIGVSFSQEIIAKGIAATTWQGRFQCIGEDPLTILDGGHNPDAANAQVAALKALKCAKGVRVVVGQCADKDTADYLRTLAPVIGKLWTVPLQNPRGTKPEELANIARMVGIRNVTACESIAEGIAAARRDASEDASAVLICGSLFLVGETLGGIEN